MSEQKNCLLVEADKNGVWAMIKLRQDQDNRIKLDDFVYKAHGRGNEVYLVDEGARVEGGFSPDPGVL